MAIKDIHITFVKRNARKRGPLSSDQYNDLFNETGTDLATFSIQWNTFIVPLTSTLPDGTLDADIDALSNGLDGRTLFVNSAAMAATDLTYFNSTKNRPYTLYEQLTDLYSRVQANEDNLQNQIANIFISASNVALLDTSNLFQASNVENALAELAAKISLLQTGSSSAGIIALHLATTPHPTTDEKAAMAGTSGTPSSSNKFVTNSDSRLSDSRSPSGAAGGGLSGTYPNPDVIGMTGGVLNSDAAHGTRGGGPLHAVATPTVAGFESAADKTKLDGIATGATNTPIYSSTPTALDTGVAAIGSSSSASPGDHKHAISTAIAVGLDASSTNATGTGTALSRADHTHAIDSTSGSITTIQVGGSNADGTAAGFARRDHVHTLLVAVPSGIGLVNSAGVSTSGVRADHVHALTFNIVQATLSGATGAISFNNQNLTNLLDPVNAQDAVSKTYVDNKFETTVTKATCRVATTTDIVLAGLQTIDGITVSSGDRVLVKNQSSAANNGVYIVSSGAWARAGDANTSSEVKSGMTVGISEGTINGTTRWVLETIDPIVLGTTALSFVSLFEAGTGVVRTKNIFSVSAASSASAVTETISDTTSSLSYTQVTSMTSTPGAGSYIAFFNGSVSTASGGTTVFIALYVNGVITSHSVRRFVGSNFGTTDIGDISFSAIISGLGAGEIVEVRWKIDATDVATIYERSLTLLKL